MAQKSSGPPPIAFVLLLLALAGGGYWWFAIKPKSQVATIPGQTTQPTPTPGVPTTNIAPPVSVPPGTAIRIDGSTSMVTINQNLKRAFETQFPGTTVTPQANGSENGIKAVIAGQADIAAVSRPLTSAEQAQGLAAQPIGADQIAIVVGKTNPFQGGLTSAQVASIFQGQINNWSGVGGQPGILRVVNRPLASGTHQAFKDLALRGGNFGTTPNITTLPRDETTGLLRELKTDGIGYGTYSQVKTQQTVRVVPIDGITPDAPNYPFGRQLFYVYKNPPTPAVQSYLGYTGTPQGQQAILAGG